MSLVWQIRFDSEVFDAWSSGLLPFLSWALIKNRILRILHILLYLCLPKILQHPNTDWSKIDLSKTGKLERKHGAKPRDNFTSEGKESGVRKIYTPRGENSCYTVSAQRIIVQDSSHESPELKAVKSELIELLLRGSRRWTRGRCGLGIIAIPRTTKSPVIDPREQWRSTAESLIHPRTFHDRSEKLMDDDNLEDFLFYAIIFILVVAHIFVCY